jgi:meso-butanediol dehydrogenase / (S,S)-butanediol dehydrogenase / diacetyl reductase
VARTIVITGAGIGLGRALARRFARDGETVVLLGRTLSKVQTLAEELGAPHFAVECDVGQPDSVRAAFAAIAERQPKIDVLINNAAIYEPFMVADATDEQILSIMNTNFAGPIFTSRAAIPMMEKGGAILNVTSESVALEFPMLSLYASTKTGLERFTESLSKELHRARGADVGRRQDRQQLGSGGRAEVLRAVRQVGHRSALARDQPCQFGNRRVSRPDRPAARRPHHPRFHRSAPPLNPQP